MGQCRVQQLWRSTAGVVAELHFVLFQVDRLLAIADFGPPDEKEDLTQSVLRWSMWTCAQFLGRCKVWVACSSSGGTWWGRGATGSIIEWTKFASRNGPKYGLGCWTCLKEGRGNETMSNDHANGCIRIVKACATHSHQECWLSGPGLESAKTNPPPSYPPQFPLGRP